ncbi:hypothetical protein [Bradyrhizobium sp. AZCC 2289]|uniref:hypothetical protein n=1 Tax=Bradyrhizobium sp. AZCC 2289 TaxID=3117026 RepID=UPI002FF17531
MGKLKIGRIYRLEFPGIAARVIEPPAGHSSAKFPFLVESLVLRSRWYVNELGEPDNVHSPRLVVPDGDSEPPRPVSNYPVSN